MKNLKKLREESNITQAALAREIGISKQTLNNYELGKRQASYETIIQIADFFNVSIDELLGRNDDGDLISSLNTKILEHFDDDISSSINAQEAVDRDAISEMSRMRGTIVKPLTYRQQQIVSLFSRLTESQQDNIIGRAELLVEQNEEASNQESV